MNAIHEPAVAGSFYPGAAAELTDTVAALLDAVEEYGGPAPKALIVPLSPTAVLFANVIF